MNSDLDRPYLLLDLGGVVFYPSGKINSLVDWEVIQLLNEVYAHEMNVGNISFNPFLREYNEHKGMDLSQVEFLSHLFETIEFNHELVSFVKENFTTIIASDNYRENIQFIQGRFNLDQWCKDQVYSYDLNVVKENPEFFRLLKSNLGLQNTPLILLDDSPEKIAAAESEGIKGILHLNNHNSIQQLRKLM